jgi:type IV secretory pathway TrbD component
MLNPGGRLWIDRLAGGISDTAKRLSALGLGLRLWIAGLVMWAVGHMAAVWAAKRDPEFVEVARRHVRYPAHLGS